MPASNWTSLESQPNKLLTVTKDLPTMQDGSDSVNTAIKSFITFTISHYGHK